MSLGITNLHQLVSALNVLSAALAVWSASFWLRSASLKINWSELAVMDGPRPKVLATLTEQGRLNAKAAALAASVAIIQALVAFIAA